MEHENTTWKSVHNAFEMGMVRLAATWHQKNFLIYTELTWHFLQLLNYFRKLFEISRGYFQTCISWNNQGKVFLERRWSNILIKKGEEWWTDHEKNIKMPLQSRLLDFLLFHIKRNQQNLWKNACEKIVYNKF